MARIELSSATYKPYEEKMQTTLRVLDDEFNTIRAGRANPRLLDRITVPYYGVETPLNQVANVQVPEARLITITPWETKVLTDIEKAIQASDLGINPLNDGKMIRLAFPELTEDRRKDLTKDVSRMGEEAKVSLRNIRREALDLFKKHLKNSDLSEDEYYVFEDEIQKLTDRYTEKVDSAVEKKSKELMEL
ncbi:MAG: ribosome recycling factor [Eubacteriales bacterium]|nr:ribosome recycling factor [Eubacteriales bacterium]